MMNCNITFIGGGNMARSFIGGLVASKFPPQKICVSDPKFTNLRELMIDGHPIQAFANNILAIRGAHIIILSVKPQQLQIVVEEIAPHWKLNTVLISIAASIKIEDLTRWLRQDTASIIRSMPNMTSLVQSSATALYANEHVNENQYQLSTFIFRSIGLALWINDEAKLDVVTALSGGGPAYFILVMEAMEKAAVKLGLDSETARLLCVQTAFGTAKMILDSNGTTTTLYDQITSFSGTTERALHELKDGGLCELFDNALIAATSRSRELSKQLGQDNT